MGDNYESCAARYTCDVHRRDAWLVRVATRVKRPRAHVVENCRDRVSDSARCQSSGAALGSRAYNECRTLLKDTMSLEKDVLPGRGYSRALDRN